LSPNISSLVSLDVAMHTFVPCAYFCFLQLANSMLNCGND
jgi:hypothetical protein